jgi:hypothetical protein
MRLGKLTILACVLMAAVMVGILCGRLLDWSVVLGANIPQVQLGLDYSWGVLIAFLLGISILVWPVSWKDRQLLILLWGVRCVVTLFLMLFYEAHYGLDAYMYFDKSKTLSPDWVTDLFSNGTQTVINFTALLSQILAVHSYHALKVIYSMFGLVAGYLFYRAACMYLRKERRDILLLFGLYPSFLFWSSMLGKDPIIILGCAIYAVGVVGYWRERHTGYIAVVILGVMISGLIRVWMMPILLAPLIVFGLRGRGMRAFVTNVLLLVLVTGGGALGISRFAQEMNVQSQEDIIKATNNISHQWNFGGSAGKTATITSVSDLVRVSIPEAFGALFRPLPFEVMNVFGFLAGLEDLILVALLVRAWARLRLSDLKNPIIQWLTLLITEWALVYGPVSAQNMGTAVRFRLQILPFLLAQLLYLGRAQEPEGVPSTPQPDLKWKGILQHVRHMRFS